MIALWLSQRLVRPRRRVLQPGRRSLQPSRSCESKGRKTPPSIIGNRQQARTREYTTRFSTANVANVGYFAWKSLVFFVTHQMSRQRKTFVLDSAASLAGHLCSGSGSCAIAARQAARKSAHVGPSGPLRQRGNMFPICCLGHGKEAMGIRSKKRGGFRQGLAKQQRVV